MVVIEGYLHCHFCDRIKEWGEHQRVCKVAFLVMIPQFVEEGFANQGWKGIELKRDRVHDPHLV